MNPIHIALLIGLAFGLACSGVLMLALRARWQATARRATLAETDHRIQGLHADIGRLQQLAALDKTGHQNELEAVMQDCDTRIAIYARRASAFTQDDRLTLEAAAAQLDLAARTYSGMRLGDHVRFANQMQQRVLDLAARFKDAAEAPLRLTETTTSNLPERPRAEGRGLVHGHHFVVDLETESTAPNAAITAIGVAYVHIPDDGFGVPLRYEYYARTEPLPGAHSDPETLNWWARQSEAARAEVNGTLPRITLAEALEQLDLFVASMCEAKSKRLVWGNGSSFDNVILSNGYRTLGRRTPWEFWNDRDLRTLLAMFPSAKQSVAFVGTQHHALHDARHEAQLLLASLIALSALEADAKEDTPA